MSRSKLTTPVIAAAGLLGGGLYFASSSRRSADKQQQHTNASLHPDEIQARKRLEHNDAKRDLVGSGAGLGVNSQTGGPELGAGIKSSNTGNPSRETPRPGSDVARDSLPAGGVEGGYGGGNANARSIEKKASRAAGAVTDAKDAVKDAVSGGGTGGFGGTDTASENGLSPRTKNGKEAQDWEDKGGKSFSEALQGAAGTGGPPARGQGREVDPKDTKVWSHHADTPSNRGGSPFDKHRKDVTAVSNTSE